MLNGILEYKLSLFGIPSLHNLRLHLIYILEDFSVTLALLILFCITVCILSLGIISNCSFLHFRKRYSEEKELKEDIILKLYKNTIIFCTYTYIYIYIYIYIWRNNKSDMLVNAEKY